MRNEYRGSGMSFDDEVMMDDCWDAEIEGDRFSMKTHLNPLIGGDRICMRNRTIGFIAFIEEGEKVYRSAGELDRVVHDFDEQCTLLEGRLLT